jgi:hypothetical protein
MLTKQHFKLYCEIALSKNIITKAMKISMIVGTALNLINQGEALLMLELENLNFLKLALTYFVPYSVTTYTATSMKLEFQIGTRAIIEADLKCGQCSQEIHVKALELIPECTKCGIHTKWKLK